MTTINIVAAHRAGVGGYCYTINSNGQPIRQSELMPGKTMHAAILLGTFRALIACPDGTPIEVRTNYQNLTKGMTEWLPRWMASGWQASNGKRVKQAALWRNIVKARGPRQVSWTLAPNGTDDELERLRMELDDELQRRPAKPVRVVAAAPVAP